MTRNESMEPNAEQKTPVYFDDEVVDHLVGIVLELGAELWVTRERLARLEEALENGKPVSVAELDQSRPSEALQNRLTEQRQAFIRRVYSRLYSRSIGLAAATKLIRCSGMTFTSDRIRGHHRNAEQSRPGTISPGS
jgi:hypothetical protein